MKKENIFDILIISILSVLSVGITTYLNNFTGPVSGDALTYATIARNIVENGMLMHNSVLPSTIVTNGGYPYHDVSQAHGYVYFESVFFWLFGSSTTVAGISSAFAYVLLTISVYWIGFKLFNRKTGLLAAIIIMLSRGILIYQFLGLTEILTALLLLWIGYILIAQTTNKWYFLTGIFIGFLYLVRPSTATFLMPAMLIVLVLVYIDKKQLNILISLLFGSFFVLLPELLWNAKHASNNSTAVSGLIHILFSHDAQSFLEGRRMLILPKEYLEPLEYFMNNKGYYFKVYFKNIAEFLNHFVSNRFVFIAALPFLMFYAITLENKSHRLFRILTLLFVIFCILGFSISWPLNRYLIPILPMIVLSIAYTSTYILSSKSYTKAFKTIILVCVLSMPAIGAAHFVKMMFMDNTQKDYNYIESLVDNNFNQSGLLVSNYPSWAGWYANHRFVALPTTVNELIELDKNYENIDGILWFEFESDVNNNKPTLKDWFNRMKHPPEYIGNTYALKERVNKKGITLYLYTKK